ncbi:serine hydrolase domain-containing protein [Crossiella sp. CA198]|uniref:serine hydrolase domain-containing protein n=1 Tax=Crossiella sp. CA198 TaxID=3455607 RepID=UPI003F8D8E08
MSTTSKPTRLAVALATAAAVAGLTAPAALADPPKHAATQAAIDTQRSARAAIGAGATVRDGDTMWSVTSGTRMLGQALPVGPEHRVRAGSLTKTFTAAMMLQLAEEDLVDLNASVETYLPGVVQGNGYDGRNITVRQLLNHTSGIFDYVDVALRNPQFQLRQFTLAQVAALGLANPPYFAPGQGWRYSGTNFILAGMIIEAVTKRGWIEELTARIITPLGLSTTMVPVGTKALPPGHVRGYLGRVVYLDVTQMFEPSIGGSSGGIVTSGQDATKFLQALLTGKVVPPARLAEMLTPYTGPGAPEIAYGLGISRYPLPCGGEAWGHNGLWPGYESNAVATADGRAAFTTVNVLDPFGGGSGGSALANGGGPGLLANATVTALCDKS